jgi:hypothetical protein
MIKFTFSETLTVAPGMDTAEGNTALAVIRVSSKPLESGRARSVTARPTTLDWKDALNGPCIDLDQTKLSPRINPKLKTNSLGRVSIVIIIFPAGAEASIL